MSNMRYSNDGIDNGLFAPHVLDRNARDFDQYMKDHTPAAVARIRNFTRNINTPVQQKSYSQEYVIQLVNYIKQLEQQNQSLDSNLQKAISNIHTCNSTITRLDGLIDDLEARLSKYEKV
ncbi:MULTISPECIES: hypothetical protein [Acinetobacter]|uniref:Uncharacterized protein n=4 Tax=Acinetobacter baumannii TaxID=470 RepID=A0A090B806_ACIBA|nr:MULTISPECIES: hypothetical protein [Acinetobacter]AKQ32478.1 hypothetical protein ACX61_18910 [Acinetobacter baumannii]ALG88261.1 hypothetical protein [Acinetobacter baumannii]AMQ95673.1 hypothetical protein [Acinetobacter baumannii]ASS85413.1 hypothetical protein [Acinetobacter baumannii]EHU1275445.1 hypothetical protein [Acinetobacter baumannii]